MIIFDKLCTPKSTRILLYNTVYIACLMSCLILSQISHTKNNMLAQAAAVCFKQAQDYQALDKVHDAITHYRKTLAIDPYHLEACFNCSYELHKLGEFQEAITLLDHALTINQEFHSARYNLAHLYRTCGKFDVAQAHYKKLIISLSDNPAVHYGLGESYLATGDFINGFAEFEWRYKRSADTRNFLDRQIDFGNFLNIDLKDKKVIIRGEYGLGDTLQFIRYAHELKKMGAYVIAEVQEPLIPLLSLFTAIDQLVAIADPVVELPDFDMQVPVMSLPRLYATTLETIPNSPYLNADQALVEFWGIKIQEINNNNIKIGICWDVSPYFESFKSPLSRKSIPLNCFEPLSQIPGVSLYSLQKINGSDQLNNLPESMMIHSFGNDIDTSHGRFMDTAAIIANMDLIITVDTSVAHLSGALGKPTWVLLPEVADWRWLTPKSNPTYDAQTGYEGSPWYQNMRIFRSPTHTNWKQLMEKIAQELTQYVHNFVQKLPTKTLRTPSTIESILTEVAVGELVDKMTILEIKSERIHDAKKLANIHREFKTLNNTYITKIPQSSELTQLKNELLEINKQLWDIEDAIREEERFSRFGQEFIDLARSVYVTNDKRCEIKRAINMLVGSQLIEEKSYTDYTKKAVA